MIKTIITAMMLTSVGFSASAVDLVCNVHKTFSFNGTVKSSGYHEFVINIKDSGIHIGTESNITYTTAGEYSDGRLTITNTYYEGHKNIQKSDVHFYKEKWSLNRSTGSIKLTVKDSIYGSNISLKETVSEGVCTIATPIF